MKKILIGAISILGFSICSASYAAPLSFSPPTPPAPLPENVASLPQASANHFDGLVIPGLDSYENTYKEAFARIYWRAKQAGKEQSLIETSKDKTNATFGTRWYGNPKAPIKVLELESLTCTHCAEFANSKFDQIKKDYIDTGKIYYGIRQLSSDRVSVTATILASTLDNEHYLSYTKSIYQNQYRFFKGNIKDAGNILRNISNLAGFSNEQFDKAWNNNPLGERVFLQGLGDVTYYSKAFDKYGDGKNAGGIGTPFFVATDGHNYAFDMGADPKSFDAMISHIENKKDDKKSK